MSVAIDFKDMLVTGSIGTFAATSGWGIYVSKEPATPNTVITVYETGGMEPNAKWALDYPTIQIRIRGDVNGYQTGIVKAFDVKNLLLGKANTTVNSNKYIGIWCNSDVNFLKYDDLNRPIFVINFRAVVAPASIGNRLVIS